MGPLTGIRIVEIAGLGAAPYACMMLADMGADVVRVDRPGGSADTLPDSPLLRNRRSVALDLKDPAGLRTVLALIEKADALIEGFRPGVAERLGIGPQDCLARNARLVYGRMTGWGQEGPLAGRAGHDLNFISLAGLLHQIGPTDGKPAVPLNVIGDFGGGLLLAFGVMCALWECRTSGRGQIVDAAMLDAALSFMAMFFGYRAHGEFADRTGMHLLAGAAHYYDTYETSDRRYMAVACIEPQFYRRFLELMGLDSPRWLAAGYPAAGEHVREEWARLKLELAALFRSRSRDEWCALFEGKDACVTPVLTLAEAAAHPHNRARGAFIDVGGMEQNAPAPRFSSSVPAAPTVPPRCGADCASVFDDWGIPPDKRPPG
jgi:alpha-methylacyl-CoA racemase